MDFAMINTWIYFKMANSEEAKSNESHADFFVQIAWCNKMLSGQLSTR